MQDNLKPSSGPSGDGRVDRRSFLRTAGRALGSLALVGAYPAWTMFSRRDQAATAVRTTWAMGTQVHLSLAESDEVDRITRDTFGALSRVQDRLSAHDLSSSLSRLNADAGAWKMADPDMASVVEAALRIADLTGGAMDVTVLPAMRAYGFMPGTVDPAFRERIGYTHLRTDGSRVKIDEGGYAVDFGGIAKGYGVDEGIKAARAARVTAALLEAGGDLFALSRPHPDRLWSIGIRDPRHTDRIFARFDVEDEAVATSGTYFQRRLVDGREVSHLVDPRTGEPAGMVLSATVIAPDAMTADALATAACVLEHGEARSLFESLPDVEALWMLSSGKVVMTSGLQRRIEFV